VSDETVSLREYVDAMFAEREKAVEAALAAQEKAVTAALESSDKAIDKAEANAEKWRASANEWRGAMSDRDRELPSRREVDTALMGVSDRTRVLERQVARAYGVAAGAVALAGVAVAIVLAGHP
jgi:hypothetical protein